MKQYKVEYVAKTGGVKFDELGDKWCNPANDTIKDYVIANIKKGDVVEVDVSDDYKFGFIKKTNAVVSSEPKTISVNADKGYGVPMGFDAKTLDIHKQVALKTAFDFIQVDAHVPPEVREELEKYGFALAKRMESWLNES